MPHNTSHQEDGWIGLLGPGLQIRRYSRFTIVPTVWGEGAGEAVVATGGRFVKIVEVLFVGFAG